MPETIERIVITPPRPTRATPSVLSLVVDAVVEDINTWLVSQGETALDGDDEADLRPTLGRVVLHSTNGYEACRELEDKGFIPDSELVDVFDDVDFHFSRAVDAAVTEWMLAYGVAPKLGLGASVLTPRRSGGEQPAAGIIADIDRVRGTYLVRVPELGHVPRGESGVNGFVYAWELLEAQPEQSSTE